MDEAGAPAEGGADPREAGGSDGGSEPIKVCAEEGPKFDACGGDLVGTWELVSVCPIEPIALETCPAGTIELKTHYPAGVTFTFDGSTATATNGTLSTSMVVTIPLSCASDLMEEEIEACDELSGPESGDCTGAEVCTCVGSRDEDHIRAFTQPYSTADGKLSVASSEWTDIPYCVEGDWLLLVYGHTVGDGGLLHVLQRK